MFDKMGKFNTFRLNITYKFVENLMPYPAEYQRASDTFSSFFIDVRDNAQMRSSHMAFTMTQGILQVFRRRLSLEDAIRFANILPAGIRALFVADWNPFEERKQFCDRDAMIAEARTLRSQHNFITETETPLEDVAKAIRKHVDEKVLDELLETLPKGAADFFRV